MNKKNIFEIIEEFNGSTLRKNSIPMGYVPAWPAVRVHNRTLLLTIPYFRRQVDEKRAALYPIYCSVTIPVENPSHLMDYTLYPMQKEWDDVDYRKPAGYFEPQKQTAFKSKEEYQAKCMKLFDYYQQFCDAVKDNKPFSDDSQMADLMKQLVEPELIPYYLRINRGFYHHFLNNV